MDEGRDVIQLRRPLYQGRGHILFTEGGGHEKDDEEEIEDDDRGLNEVVDFVLAQQLGDDAETQSKEKDDLDDEGDIGAQTRAGAQETRFS